MNNNSTIVVVPVTLFMLSAVLLNTPYVNTAYAQEGPPGEAGVTDEPESPFTEQPTQPGPETATELEEAAGSDEAILANDTTISNPNNTALDATAINEREDCMQIPGNTAEDCP
jgi:hypothetical protein